MAISTRGKPHAGTVHAAAQYEQMWYYLLRLLLRAAHSGPGKGNKYLLRDLNHAFTATARSAKPAQKRPRAFGGAGPAHYCLSKQLGGAWHRQVRAALEVASK